MEDKTEGIEGSKGKGNPQKVQAKDSHDENFSDAVEKALDSNDDRAVELAGQKGGLRAALAARMDGLSRVARRYSDHYSFKTEPTRLTGLRLFDAAAHGAGVEMYWLPAKAVEKTAGFMRDRLQPKQPTSKSPEASKTN